MPALLTPDTLDRGDAREAPAVDFETRLALRDAEMGERCRMAVTALDVTAARPETVVDPTDIVTRPVDWDAPTETPVAALLHRAAQRLRTGGWCRDAARAGSGSMCLTEAIRAEAHTHEDEGKARRLVRRLGGGDPIPEMNRRLHGAGHAAQVLDQAANTAAQRGN